MIAILEPAKAVSGGVSFQASLNFEKKILQVAFFSHMSGERYVFIFSFPFFGVKNEGYKWALGRKR